MTIEDLLLSYMEANLDALKESQDFETLKARVYKAKAWAEEQYATITLGEPKK